MTDAIFHPDWLACGRTQTVKSGRDEVNFGKHYSEQRWQARIR